MLGKSAIVGFSDSPANNRTFVYEVAQLRQNEENDKNNYSFRTSSNVFIQVPYSRMNEEMRRINRMGGKIVSIKPIGGNEE